jgi:hypothetical protein
VKAADDSEIKRENILKIKLMNLQRTVKARIL